MLTLRLFRLLQKEDFSHCGVSHRCAFDLVFHRQAVCIRPTDVTTDRSVEQLLFNMGDSVFLNCLRRDMAKRRHWEEKGTVQLIRDYSRAWYVCNIQTSEPRVRHKVMRHFPDYRSGNTIMLY